MLTARYGTYRRTDFRTKGIPNLDYYYEYEKYERIVLRDRPEISEMLVPGGVKNAAGQVIIPEKEVRPKNDVNASVEWYVEALTSTPPILTGGAYVEEHRAELVRLIVEQVKIACGIGHGAVYSVDGQLRLTSGVNLAPLQDPGNPVPYGWTMYWPYYQRPENDTQGRIFGVPNRIKVRDWISMDDQFQATFHYNGGVIGMPVMDDSIQEESPIEALAVFGVDEGFIREAMKFAGEVARLDAVIREICTTFGLPIAIINAKLGLDMMGSLVDLQGRPVRQTTTANLQATDPSGPPLEFIQAMGDISGLMAEREEWMKRFHEVTRIPIDLTQNRDNDMSGVSRALMARPAIDRIESLQKSITEADDQVIRELTGSGLEIEWPRQPFDTLAERRLVGGDLYDRGAISLNEYREEIGYGPVEGGDNIYAGSERNTSDAVGSEQDGGAGGNPNNPRRARV